MNTYFDIVRNLRRDLRTIGGVKLKLETMSWGHHASIVFEGPQGEIHRAGNIAPPWWAEEHIEKYNRAADLCRSARHKLEEIGEKLPGLLT